MVTNYKEKGMSIGFVPTMGALHEGHISLIHASKKQNDITVCSIFINPAQFNDLRDFEKYPKTIDKDIYKLVTSECDILFMPDREEIYPASLPNVKHYNIGYLEEILEGKYRPGHFQGVCRVVDILLNIIKPGKLYLGQKDFQQCKVIARLLTLINLEDTVRIVICPTMRENDGLAMSSRNMRLNDEQRKTACFFPESIRFIKEHIGKESIDSLLEKERKKLGEKGFSVDYLEVADTETLKPIKHWDGKQGLIILGAATIGEVRLIDNMILE